MEKLTNISRIFYGLAIAGLGFQTIYYRDFPYMIIPPNHFWIPGLIIFAYISGIIFMLAGVCIVVEIKTRTISLLLGTALLLIFCFYFIPYELIADSNFLHFGEWENAEKELALSCGAFVIAGLYSGKTDNYVICFLSKLIPFGTVFYCITIICFGIDHFLYAKSAADYIPSWISNHMFWIYFAGVALIGSGVGIILKIKPVLNATLLGTMIFIWVIILHIPKAIANPVAYMGSEVTSAFLALAYCGIAFAIAGSTKKTMSIK